MLFSFALSAIVLASSVFGSPLEIRSQCQSNLSGARLTLPKSEAALAPPNAGPTGIVLGVGVQNYTCTDAGNYTSVAFLLRVNPRLTLLSRSLIVLPALSRNFSIFRVLLRPHYSTMCKM